MKTEVGKVSELPIQVESLLGKYGKKLERMVHERSEEEVQRSRKWRSRIVGAAGVIARKDEKFVLVRHTREAWGDAHRYWSFPGGGVEHGEEFEEAAVREFKEETGLNVEITGLVSVCEHVDRSPQGSESAWIMAIFKGKVVGGEMRPETPNEISEVRLFEEPPEKSLVPWVRETYPEFEDI